MKTVRIGASSKVHLEQPGALTACGRELWVEEDFFAERRELGPDACKVCQREVERLKRWDEEHPE